MAVEVLSYRLNLRGKPVGSHVLRTEEQNRVTRLEAKLSLQGGLGQHTIVQTSRVQRQALYSFMFSEEVLEGPDQRRYEVRFDRESGLVKASRGPNDNAEIPYVRPFNDPLGLLYQVRRLGEITESVRVPMLGKDVTVEHLRETELDTVLGERKAYVYLLSPGGGYVYVDSEAPHVILKLTQRAAGQKLDALLVKIAEEAAMPDRDDEGGGRKRNRRRRGRRRRRRRSKS